MSHPLSSRSYKINLIEVSLSPMLMSASPFATSCTAAVKLKFCEANEQGNHEQKAMCSGTYLLVGCSTLDPRERWVMFSLAISPPES